MIWKTALGTSSKSNTNLDFKFNHKFNETLYYSEVLNISYPLVNEPFTLDEVHEAVFQRQKEEEFWQKHKKAPE